MKVQFLNIRPLATTWETDMSGITESALFEEVKNYLPCRPLEFDLEHGVIYSRYEQVGSFRVISPDRRDFRPKHKAGRVVSFQRR